MVFPPYLPPFTADAIVRPDKSKQDKAELSIREWVVLSDSIDEAAVCLPL